MIERLVKDKVMSVTVLDDHRPHRAGPAICHSCWEEATIVAPESIDAEWKECGKCGERRVQFCDQPTPVEILYNELLHAVESKHPEETRHQTALRYIRERESGGSGPVSAA